MLAQPGAEAMRRNIATLAPGHPVLAPVMPPLLRMGFVLCVLVAVGLRAWLLLLPSGYYGEGVYWQSLRALARGNALFTQVFSSQPPLFLTTLQFPFAAFGNSLLAARVTVLALSMLALIGIYWIAKPIAGRWAGWLTVLLLATDPVFVRLSVTLLANVPAIGFEVLCVALASAAGRAGGSLRPLLAGASGCALALGTLNKLFVVIAVVPALLYLVDVNRPRRSVAAIGTFAAGAAIATAAVLVPFGDRLGMVYDQVIHYHLVAGRVRGDLADNVRLLLLPEIQMPLTALAVVSLPFFLRRHSKKVILPPLAWLLVSFACLLGLQPLFEHHLVLLAPPLALVAGLGVTSARGNSEYGRALMTGVGLVAALGVAINVVQATRQTRALSMEHPVVAQLAAVTKPDDLVVSDEQAIVAMANRDVPLNLVDTSSVRLRTGYLSEANVQASAADPKVRAVLFTGGRMQDLNHFRRWVEANFRLCHSFGGEWVLYVR
jgi:4-amino-4-deoxy-L-arabinose transferase-like glycosyltransferase